MWIYLLKIISKKIILLIIFFLFQSTLLPATTITVPTASPTIKEAIYMAKNGDIVEVEDGFYFEENIVIDKDIIIKAKNLYGAVIEGSRAFFNSIFIVRAQAEIVGFVLRNAYFGILQRHSPDVAWTAHDLVIMDMICFGVGINDASQNIGSAYLYNIIVDNSGNGFYTNDACGLDIENCLITSCSIAFGGSNHYHFNVDKVSIWNCRELYNEDKVILSPPAISKINFGKDIFILDSLLKKTETQNISSSYNILNNSEKALLKSLEHFEPLKGFVFNIMGDVYLSLKYYNRSSEWNHKALVAGKKSSSPEVIWNAYFNLGAINEKLGKPFKAVNYYKKSIETIENIRAQISILDHKLSFMRNKMGVYESLINLLFELHEGYPSKGYNFEAFYFLEKSKARSFLDSLYEVGIDIESKLSPKIAYEKKNILKNITEIQISLYEQGLSGEKAQNLLSALEIEEIKYESLMVKIKREYCEYADLIYPQPFSYEKIKKKLINEETILIEYFIGEKYSFVFLLSLDGLFISRLLEPKSLNRLFNNYKYLLMLREVRPVAGSKRLYDLLIEPISGKLRKGIKKIIIVPDGILNYLPFETLIQGNKKNEQKSRNNLRYLIQDYEISYAVSASSLINLADKKNMNKRKMDLLAIANPNLGYPDKIISNLRKDEIIKTSSLFYQKRTNNNWRLNLPTLTHAVKEIKIISKFFKKNKKELLLKKEAREKKIKRIDLYSFKIIHFAAHGVIDNKNWWRSALILKPDEDLSDDGLLQPRDIFNMNLDSDLVVLSACQTGEGKLEKGEGILGLARAFFCAGTKSIIVSLWKIDDKITPKFMKYFYQYLANGKTKAQALRLAKIKMINSKYCHPFFWAAFILNGECNSNIDI